MKTSEIITVTDTAYRGNGVGRAASGQAVFIPYTVTGDKVRVAIKENKGSYAIGELQEILHPSDWRTEPHCQYHGICGGCQFGHIEYARQLEIKKTIVLQALRKHPQIHKVEKAAVISASPVGYRLRATVRTQDGHAGFFRTGGNEFIGVEDCPVLKPGLFKKCTHWAGGYSKNNLYTLSVLENEKGEVISLVEGKGRLPEIHSEAPFNGVSCGKNLLGLPHLEFQTPAGKLGVSYGGFYQANVHLNDIFQQYPLAFSSDKVLELYAGSGFFTSALGSSGYAVQGVEINARAASMARQYGWPVESGDVSKMDFFERYGTVFVDPPREGIDKKTIAAILKIAPEKLIYVSCNPMTLARDLLRLSNRYRISDFTLFDMFPHTYHVESMVFLEKYKGGK